MATKVLWNSNVNSFASELDDGTNGNLSNTRADLRRLATFRSTDVCIHSTLTKAVLAKIGFCKKQGEMTLQCVACHFEIELSVSADELIRKHIDQKPSCQFVREQCNLLAINNQGTSSSMTTTISTSDPHPQHHSEETPNSLKTFLNSLSDETLLKMRTNTFSNWPVITPSANDMINAGWCYTNIADRVICIHCDALFHKWTDVDRPYEVHRLKSPHCPYVLSEEKNRANSNNITITTDLPTQAAVGVANSTYAVSTRRLETFANWPHSDVCPLPSVDSFVDAGFYYTGETTIVRCFYCNGALRNWTATDDPKVEHARWYPQCAYIRQYIGEDLYLAIQRKNRELKAQQNYPTRTNDDETSKTMPWTDNELDRMVRGRLDLPFVEKLRGLGFSMSIIRKSFEMQLRFKKDDFKTNYDLYLACLILDLQVKLINGNAANLLVPQQCLETLRENQEQQRNQPQAQTTLPAPMQIQTVETRKVESAPVTIQQRIPQKTDEDSMPCVLCLTAERQIACLPCGHLASCVACGHSLKTCPICRAPVKAFVRIYV